MHVYAASLVLSLLVLALVLVRIIVVGKDGVAAT